MSVRKRPLTRHGLHDASRLPAVILDWWGRWPDAVPALVCGEPSGLAVLDVDIRDKVDGRDVLDVLAGPFHPEAPTAHTPSGGYHILFKWPGRFVKSCPVAPGLDVKGDGGAVMLPPGRGRSWDPHLGLDTPIPAMPEWMAPSEPVAHAAAPAPAYRQPLSRYAEAALDNAVKAILSAPAGAQHVTLNKECFAIGGLVASGALPAALALEALTWAAGRMLSHDARRPWRPAEINRQVRDAFLDGQAHPRALLNG
jgi:hypothetical protein